MTTTQTTTTVTQSVEQIVDSVITLGTNLVRLSANTLVIPLSILPAKERQSTIDTAHQLLTSLEKLNASVLKVAGRVTTTWLGELDKVLTSATPAAGAEAKPVVIEAAKK